MQVSRLIAGLVATGAIAAIPSSAVAADNCGTVVPVSDSYVNVRDSGDIWIYQESNGEAGLQTSAAAEDPEGQGFGCGTSTNPDTIVF